MKTKRISKAVRALAMLATQLWDDKKAEEFVVIADEDLQYAAVDALRACGKDIAAQALVDLIGKEKDRKAEEFRRKYPEVNV